MILSVWMLHYMSSIHFFFKYCNFEAIEMFGSTFHYATVTLRKTVVRITEKENVSICD